MPKAKTWDELSRRQRREVRAYWRAEIKYLSRWKDEAALAEALRAALRQLAEPKKGK
jgi:hypothetical protein